MHLAITDELLERYIGGDIELQNVKGGYLLRGPIKAAQLESGTLSLELDWCAQNEGGPRKPTGDWRQYDMESHTAPLLLYSVSELDDGRLQFKSILSAEVLVLFLPGVGKLDPERVIGLIAA